MWEAERDACDECLECHYFLHEYWNCQGDIEPCLEFYPKPGSNKRLVSIEITMDNGMKNTRDSSYNDNLLS